jgi:hypothetical protein
LYGNSGAWYAPIVHERLDLHHESPTRAKYLSAAMEEHIDDFRDILAKAWAEALQ